VKNAKEKYNKTKSKKQKTNDQSKRIINKIIKENKTFRYITK
jgi:hypothetical protein